MSLQDKLSEVLDDFEKHKDKGKTIKSIVSLFRAYLMAMLWRM